jgi:hypothetical protein
MKRHQIPGKTAYRPQTAPATPTWERLHREHSKYRKIVGDFCGAALYAAGMVTADAKTCPMCGESIHEDMHQCPACGETLTPAGTLSPANSQSTEDFAKAKRHRLLWMLGLAVASGIASEVFADAERELVLLEAIGFAALVASWCSVDARERGGRIGKGQFVTIVLIPVIGLPVYLFRTRGLRGFLSILLALLFYALLIGVQICISLIADLIS